MPKRKPPKVVRQPVQVYLDPDERKLLDSVAAAAGLSRAEVLRRGLRSFAAATRDRPPPMLEFLERATGTEWPKGVAERHDAYLADAIRGDTPDAAS